MGSDAGPLGILAGGGALPRRLAEAAASQGRGAFIVAFRGQADPTTVDGFPHLWVGLGQAALTISALKQASVVDLVMAGAIRRPSLAELSLDWRGAQLFARIGARALGDDGLLRAVARELESEGFRLLRVDEILGESTGVPAGALGRLRPDRQAETDIARGIEVARVLGQADVGQAVVVQQGLVLGVEAIEGTDGLLERVRTLRRDGPEGVLVKIAKPGQDRRMDMPTVGPGTVAGAVAAGLRGIAIDTDGVILLDRRATIDAADQAGLFLFGIAPGPKARIQGMSAGSGPLVFVIAGEPSGDALGGRLMAALRRQTGDSVRFAGIGGSAMEAEGLRSLFPMAELSIMGLAEIVPRIPHMLRRIRETAAAVEQLRPEALVTIDAPDFSFRVARRVKRSGVPRIHYVAPSVWAWRPGRAAVIAGFLDHLLALLPFEPPYFERVGLPCSFVGHPAIETTIGAGDGSAFRARHLIPEGRKIVLMLPGSRQGEIRRLLPVFVATLRQMRAAGHDFKVVTTLGAHVAESVRAGLLGSALDALVVEGDSEKADAFAAADAALAKSGTVTLELALAGIPAVIGYRINPLTYAIVSRVAVGRFAGLPNVILNRPLVPELLQSACRPDRLAAALTPLLDDSAVRRAQIAGLADIRALLSLPGIRPSDAAAEIVLRVAREKAEAGPAQRAPIGT